MADLTVVAVSLKGIKDKGNLSWLASRPNDWIDVMHAANYAHCDLILTNDRQLRARLADAGRRGRMFVGSQSFDDFMGGDESPRAGIMP